MVNFSNGIINIDTHGKNTYQAKIMIDSALRKADSSVYRLRIIHGHNSGTAIKEMIWENYASTAKVKKLVAISESITDIVIREM